MDYNVVVFFNSLRQEATFSARAETDMHFMQDQIRIRNLCRIRFGSAFNAGSDPDQHFMQDQIWIRILTCTNSYHKPLHGSLFLYLEIQNSYQNEMRTHIQLKYIEVPKLKKIVTFKEKYLHFKGRGS